MVWDPRGLPIRGIWNNDGPLLPIEFCRQSDDGRLTLIICPKAWKVRTFWSLLALNRLEDAVRALQERENIPNKNKEKHIGTWTPQKQTDNDIINKWATHLTLDAVVWTNLPSKFNGKSEKCPTENEAIRYLRDLQYNRRKDAELYIRMTPRQIDTKYRRKIEAELGWTPIT